MGQSSTGWNQRFSFIVDRWHEHPRIPKAFHKDVRLEDCLPSWVKPNQGDRNTITVDTEDLAKTRIVSRIATVFL